MFSSCKFHFKLTCSIKNSKVQNGTGICLKQKINNINKLAELSQCSTAGPLILLRLHLQFWPITVSHGNAYTVARATQQVNGKYQFWGVCNSVTPEPTKLKFDICD